MGTREHIQWKGDQWQYLSYWSMKKSSLSKAIINVQPRMWPKGWFSTQVRLERKKKKKKLSPSPDHNPLKGVKSNAHPISTALIIKTREQLNLVSSIPRNKVFSCRTHRSRQKSCCLANVNISVSLNRRASELGCCRRNSLVNISVSQAVYPDTNSEEQEIFQVVVILLLIPKKALVFGSYGDTIISVRMLHNSNTTDANSHWFFRVSS